MKPSLAPGAAGRKVLTVDHGRCIAFMGPENAVYATPHMVSDVEYAIRDFLLRHLDPGEDSVGTRVVIDHLAATPVGMKVTLEFRVAAVEGRNVRCAFTVRDEVEECGRGEHVRFVVDVAKTAERLARKRARIA
ncbi:MAG: LysR family transcriptional regulator [Betaproteobacteria bacterium]|nr:LysR family transcriptional regulator [Betaproteobacteria bacterium]MDH5221673.1 LysR family transcriptional regulator [Betaproteobacteria bacterium]MDH5351576.1 LysR family transcriptional regulator [Betaproteobacteria bacterium]